MVTLELRSHTCTYGRKNTLKYETSYYYHLLLISTTPKKPSVRSLVVEQKASIFILADKVSIPQSVQVCMKLVHAHGPLKITRCVIYPANNHRVPWVGHQAINLNV